MRRKRNIKLYFNYCARKEGPRASLPKKAAQPPLLNLFMNSSAPSLVLALASVAVRFISARRATALNPLGTSLRSLPSALSSLSENATPSALIAGSSARILSAEGFVPSRVPPPAQSASLSSQSLSIIPMCS